MTHQKRGGDVVEAMPAWLNRWMESRRIQLWNVADLEGLAAPPDRFGRPFPRAVSWALPMPPDIMAAIQDGPNQAYADAYAAANLQINRISGELAAELNGRGHQACSLAASHRTDPVNIRGEFPHKTAATRAGLGWIGRHCQLITRAFGPWVRLGTVMTDMPSACGTPMLRSYCGRCTRCVEVCPAGALKGTDWRPGTPRERILDAGACDRWKKAHYAQYHKGHNCGICAAVCPYGLKSTKRSDPNG